MNLLQIYIDGGNMMHAILVCLIVGLAFSIERLFTLSMASINNRKFLSKIKQALSEGGVEAATEVCANTRGPVASIFHAGLLRVDRGIEHVEKAIMNAGSIEMAFLEKNLIWLATIISVAPMLGFLGTVWGMIQSFDSIKKANDISPAIVAGGISVALITTMFGLVVAIIIQTLHNYFVSRIDKLIVDMEESSTELVDSLIEMKVGAKS
ncbi:MAG: MotA/TolQ/ExbB proton channel family protein [Deferribacteres bacterium]|nr:MotA/TolQ/ExbB proton channel family protein [candidate division KSB1 bacterium]MCB9509425.1 MotA/TolQ/ExbB proton channel family protein [Deferribacteres bacterium]